MLDCTSPITLPAGSAIDRLTATAGGIQPGSVLKVKVLELSGNRALIDFGAGRTMADIKIPVTVGEELLVRVRASEPQPKLELVSSDARSFSGNNIGLAGASTIGLDPSRIILPNLKQTLLHLLGSSDGPGLSGNLRRALELLNAYFESVDPQNRTSDISLRLMAYSRNSGVFFEKVLETVVKHIRHEAGSASTRQMSLHPEVQNVLNRDLKAILSALKHFIGEDPSIQRKLDSGPSGGLRHSIDFLLSDITRQQARAVRLIDAAEPFQIFSFSLPLAHNRHPARLKVYYPRKLKIGSQQGFQISLLLTMDHLGDVRSDLYLLERDLSVTFFVRSQSIGSKIKQVQAELQKLLRPFFNQTTLRVVVSEKKINEFEQQDDQITHDHRVDLRI